MRTCTRVLVLHGPTPTPPSRPLEEKVGTDRQCAGSGIFSVTVAAVLSRPQGSWNGGRKTAGYRNAQKLATADREDGSCQPMAVSEQMRTWVLMVNTLLRAAPGVWGSGLCCTVFVRKSTSMSTRVRVRTGVQHCHAPTSSTFKDGDVRHSLRS